MLGHPFLPARRPAASLAALAVILLSNAFTIGAQSPDGWEARDREIAARFAPIFHQGLVSTGRFDYITNFDFDGDWVGDNNWVNAELPQFALKAYIYYAVSETPTHYFIHYAAFHPRDYKGGELTGALLSQAVRIGAERAQEIRRTTIADDLVLAHENDLEGCLVVAEKRGPNLEDAELVAVETLAHNRYLRYQRQPTLVGDVGVIRVEGQRPLIYIEPKGHGMEAFADQLAVTSAAPREEPAAVSTSTAVPEAGTAAAPGTGEPQAGGLGRLMQRITGIAVNVDQGRRALNNEGPERIRVYRFTATADDPEMTTGDVGYELLSTHSTLWQHARGGANTTFGGISSYGTRTVSRRTADGSETSIKVDLGDMGSAFLGREGAANMARPPWGWFDATERDRPLGEWFFDPAGSVKRRFDSLREAATAYVHQPFVGIIRPLP